MEDLKKQTALRLAQEQQKKGRRVAVDPHQNFISSSVVCNNPLAHEPYNGSQHISRAPDSCSLYPHVNHQPQSNYRYGTENCDGTPAPNQVYLGDPPQTYPNEYHVSGSASGSVNSQSNSKVTSNSKLPHGLTVQELKEMTKARLQAEAVDRSAEEFATPQNCNENLGPVPTTVRVSHEYRDHMSSRFQGQAPPVITGFHGVRSPDQSARSFDAREAWETTSVSTAASDFHGSESVYSGIHGPDDFGGPSPLARSNSHLSGGCQEWQSSYHDLPVDSAHNAPCVLSPGRYFDGSSFLPNRRRAATLSPRPGGLTYLHEDRSYNGFQMLSGMPSLKSAQATNSNRQRSASSRTRSTFVQEPATNCQPIAGIFAPSHDLNNYSSGNRARTSSTVSLPAISHTAEEFSVAPSGCLDSCTTPQRFSNQFYSVREDAPSPSVTGLSSVFREAHNVSNFPNGVDERFRGSAFSSLDIGSSSSLGFESVPMRKRAETDFLHSANSAFGHSENFGHVSGNHGDSRIRAATWGEPSLDMYGLGLFGEMSKDKQIDDGLADDLASILKLSGAEQKDGIPFAPPGF